jgi:hypothetical protein
MSARTDRIEVYRTILRDAVEHGHLDDTERRLCKSDLFYLLAYVLRRPDVQASDWLYDRCIEVQASPDGHLDLWSREHYKSTLITFALTIQDILKDPNVTIGIFSHTKPIARAFLRQIKYELETNERLKQLFPAILWADPKSDAVKAGCNWSEDKGITVQRTNNDKESHGRGAWTGGWSAYIKAFQVVGL